MTYSREQLVFLALKELGVPGAGQTPSAEDKATVDEKFNSVMADLAQRNIYVWGDPDQTDDAAAIHFSVCLAQACCREFGQAKDETARLLAESRLRALKLEVLSGQPQTTEYY